MLKSIIKALGFVVGLALSGVVCAMGMGGINVTTALGEPLKAEIELAAVGKAEKNSLSAHLASPDVFKGAGMDYPVGLPAMKFQIETRANGDPYLSVTSAQPVNEPFVSILVELNWSSGKLLREYTFLLDPPDYKAEQPKAAEVKPVAPSAAAAPGAAPIIAPPPSLATAPVDEKVFAGAVAPGKKPTESGNVASGIIKVKRGDTLIGIARQSKPSEVSLERMLVALYRSNTDAFDGNNMNRLKTGKILYMPGSRDFEKLAQADAVKEIHVQVADWYAYRQKLASARGAVAEHAPKQEVSGKISTTVADKTPAARESAREVVRLSKGEAPGDKPVAAGNAKALQDKVYSMEEEAIARSKALKENNERIALLEKNIKEMQHLLELKGQFATPPKPAPSKAEGLPPAKIEDKPPEPVSPAATAIVAASAIAPASAVKPARPAAKPVAVPAPPPSLLDEPLYLAGGVAALLALGGLGFMLARRGKGGKAKKSGGKAAAKEVAGGHISAPVAPSPETGDFTQAAIAAPISPAQPEDVDPINEADLFLSFGRDVQAEEILKDALEKNPASNPIRLKLLSIYLKRKDTNQFSVIARQVQGSRDAAAWAQTAEMGRNLEPNNPMYGVGGEPIIAAAPVGQGKAEHAAGLDFDLGFGEPDTSESTVAPSAPSDGIAAHEVDFDLGFDAPEVPATNEKTDTMSGLDFDLGMAEQSPPEAVEDYTSTMVLDAPLAMPQEESQAELETPVDIGITAQHHPVPEQSAAITPDLDDLVFDITVSSPAVIVEEKPAADVSVSTGDALAFMLDFPASTEPAPAQAEARGAMDFDMSAISLDMGEPTPPASSSSSPAIKDEHWHDVSTKLDLAKAYQEMGDNAGAREILEEVLAEGDEQQRAAAGEMLKKLSA